MFGTGAWKIISNSPKLRCNFDQQTLNSSSDECLLPVWKNRPDRCLKSSLEGLPVELLQSISCYLSLSSAASLALCNHRMNHIIGRQSWSSLELWTEELEKTKFLHYLKKGLPDHRICHRCIKLHCEIPVRDVQLTQFVPEEPERKQKIGVAYSYPPINITFQQVQSALNRHHLGSNQGLPLDFFHRRLPKGPLGLCFCPSTKARIVADEFILRSNYWIPKWPDRTGPDPNLDNPIRLCPHMTIYYGDPRIMQILECQLHHSKDCHCAGRKYCDFCSTEFDVGLCSGEAGSRVLYITTWRTFGCGRCPKDPKWQGHVLKPKNFLHKTRVFYKRDGNIRLGYESWQTSASKFLEYEREFFSLFSICRKVSEVP